MEYMTYKEFEREINKIGCHSEEGYYFIYVKHGLTVVAAIDKENLKNLNLSFDGSLCVMEESERNIVADLCWILASTPLEDREEQNLYHLKVYPKYSPFFDSDCDYLNIDRDNEMVISTKHETSLYKTIFTEEEINELAKEYDLSLFEKVEVEDEQ